MASADSGRFRITVWPGTPLPVPKLLTSECQLSDSGGALFILKPEETAESHGEIYLELANLDLEDGNAIAAFANKYSVLQGRDLYSRLRDAGLFTSHYPHRRPSFPREQRLAYEEASRERAFRDDLPVRTKIETLHEFRFAATIFAEMVDAWHYLSTGGDRRPSGDPEFALAKRAWSQTLLRQELPALLRNYTPTVAFQKAPGRGSAWQRPDIVAAPPVATAPLFEVCGFELFNHIVQDVTYRHCENETCGRLFVHQHGRAHFGQSRSYGVKYCSYRCAQAQNQRSYRRRKQAKLRNLDRQ